MKLGHILLMAILTFFWIWSLPLLCVAFMLGMPTALFALPVSVVISLVLQYLQHGRIMPNTLARQWFSRIPWHEWFPCNTLRARKTSVIAVHPHGLLCCGAIAGIHFVQGATTVFCVAPLLFYVPLIGWLLRLLGFIPAHYDIMLRALQRGHSVIVVPGGVPELVMAETGDDTCLFERHGFLRLASEARVPVLSVFVKGECATYAMVRAPLLHWRVWLSWKSNVPLVVPLFLGYYGTWMPKRTPLKLRVVRNPARERRQYRQNLKRLIHSRQKIETR